MRKVWILVANSSLAKIYYAENANHLIEKKTLEHYESHLHARDLYSDKNGETNQRMLPGRHPYQSPTSPKVKERIVFADQIAAFLEESFNAGEFERLYVIANAAMLGHLRETFSKNLVKAVVTEIDKDLTLMKPAEIRDYLPPVL